MQPIMQIRESVLYTWNDNPSLRRWVKLLTCPCFGCCYLSSHIPSWYQRAAELRAREQTNRFLVMSEVKQAQRERRLKNRKRSVSVDGRQVKKFVWKKRETAGQNQSELFGKLPAELRLEIYKLVLCSQERMHVRPMEYRDEEDMFRVEACLGRSTEMLRTCRRLYREAVEVLYSGNNFSFACYRRFIVFARSIPPPRLNSIRHVTIVHRAVFYSGMIMTDKERFRRNCEYEDFFTLLASLPKLKILDLRYMIDISDGPRFNLDGDLELLNAIESWPGTSQSEVWYEIDGVPKALGRYRLWRDPGENPNLFCGKWRVCERTRLR